MGLVLSRIEDPRDALQRARHMELFKFAQANGVHEIEHRMPAEVMRRILRAKGLTNIQIPRRVLGQPEPKIGLLNSKGKPLTLAAQTPEMKAAAPEIDATDDLLRQYMAQRALPAVAAPEPAKKPQVPLSNKREAWREMTIKQMGVNDMRWACKASNIHLDRRDNKATLSAKLKAAGFK